jgi:hypothetical protein
VLKARMLGAALLLTGWRRAWSVLLVASLLVGLFATVAQDIVPAAATLAPPGTRQGGGHGDDRPAAGDPAVARGERLRGRAFRLARVFIAAAAGQRRAGGGRAGEGLAALRADHHLSYPALLHSLAGLWMQHRKLRQAALAQGLLSVGFSPSGRPWP